MVVSKNFKALFDALVTIKEQGDDADDVAKAAGILDLLAKKNFDFLLIFLSKLLGIMEPANRILQKREIGYSKAMPIINATIEQIKAMRGDQSFEQIVKGNFSFE